VTGHIRPGAPTRLCPRGLHLRAAATTKVCMQCAAIDALAEVTALVGSRLPGCREDFAVLVAEAASTGEQRRRLAAHLRASPDALASGASDAPAVLVRLAHLLARAGVAGVVVPGKARRLCPAGRHERSGSAPAKSLCGRCDTEAAMAETASVVVERLPQLSTEAALGLVSSAVASAQACRALTAHLRAYPDALSSGSSDVPFVVVKLVDVAVNAGIDGVNGLRCVGCAKPQHDMRVLTPAGRMCFNCYQHRRPEPCASCGRTMPVAGRDNAGGAVCGNCRAKDRSTWQPCSRCGQTSQVVARVDGQTIGRCCYARPVIRCTMCGLAKGIKPWKTRRPVCPDCRTLPTVVCSTCGRDAPPVDGARAPVCAVCRAVPALPCGDCGRPTPTRERQGAARCADCYRRPVGPCGRCGRVRAVVRLARDGDPDLCAVCWTGPTVVCESCGEVRPCRGERRQRMLCRNCSPITLQACAHCGRLKPVATRWVEGPICQACYARALAAKANCPGCGGWRRLRTYHGFADNVCSDCAGAAPYAVCRTCGAEGCLYDRGRCARCALEVRLAAIFGDPGHRGQLDPVHEALRTLANPRDVIAWLRKSEITGLLGRFARAELAVSFQALDALPRSRAVWFVEHLFTAAGVLNGRDPVLARFELWVIDYLETLGIAEHERLIRRYATWEILRTLRANSARRHLSDNAHNAAKTRLKAAQSFLDFLAQRHRTLGDCRQADLDAWGATGPAGRCNNARPFVGWAIRQRLAADLEYPSRLSDRNPNVVFGDGEWTLARHLLHDEGIEPHDRVAGLLVVLYAQNATRISRLTADDVTATDTTVQLRLGVTALRLPSPMADHVRTLLKARQQTTAAKLAGATHWLFPGQHPGRHIHSTVLAVRLRAIGVRTSTARTTALAHLAATMPAVIIADLLGISAQTAVTWSEATARARADYSAHR
jgi:hypothetical protein